MGKLRHVVLAGLATAAFAGLGSAAYASTEETLITFGQIGTAKTVNGSRRRRVNDHHYY